MAYRFLTKKRMSTTTTPAPIPAIKPIHNGSIVNGGTGTSVSVVVVGVVVVGGVRVPALKILDSSESDRPIQNTPVAAESLLSIGSLS
jgi:hypothetical protein